LEVRVVGVGFGMCFHLAVSDAGAVFSCGYNQHGALGHGSSVTEVLPRHIEALAQTGKRFVAVTAGSRHALALTENGEVYAWGHQRVSGHGRGLASQFDPSPYQLTAFIGQRVRHVDAGFRSSCAVTEKGELFTWGSREFGNLGHDSDTDVLTPKRVEGLSGGRVPTVATFSGSHTLVAGVDGVVWRFGYRMPTGNGDPDAEDDPVPTRRPIPTLRVRVCKSPDVLPFSWHR